MFVYGNSAKRSYRTKRCWYYYCWSQRNDIKNWTKNWKRNYIKTMSLTALLSKLSAWQMGLLLSILPWPKKVRSRSRKIKWPQRNEITSYTLFRTRSPLLSQLPSRIYRMLLRKLPWTKVRTRSQQPVNYKAWILNTKGTYVIKKLIENLSFIK